MTKRERLVELLIDSNYYTYEDQADYLLANGVIVPPCKVGDTVYRIFPRISDAIPPWVGDTPETVGCIGIATKNLLGNWNVYPIEEIGKTLFLTREEAEAALAERSKG